MIVIELKNFEYEYSYHRSGLMFDHQYLLPLGPISPRCNDPRTHRAAAGGLPCPLRRLMFHVISDWPLLVVICLAIAAALAWLWRF